jgi:hypothetical protein
LSSDDADNGCDNDDDRRYDHDNGCDNDDDRRYDHDNGCDNDDDRTGNPADLFHQFHEDGLFAEQ